MHKTRILVSNDDGIRAAGIQSLIEVASEFGEVTVVAPNGPQSGMGHAISLGKPLRLYKETLPNGLIGYACNGTPADCVKLATGVIMADAPDLILSGINHGANSSVSGIYSGTLSVAREGALQGIPGIGFSLCNFSHSADFTTAREVARVIIREALDKGLAKGQMLNVNIPDVSLDQLQGYRMVRQAMGRWVEEFDERIDPYGQKYYWLTGKFQLDDHGRDTDEYALAQNAVAICPMTIDLTQHTLFDHLGTWSLPQPVGSPLS
jgi:5'-nucleotidase